MRNCSHAAASPVRRVHKTAHAGGAYRGRGAPPGALHLKVDVGRAVAGDNSVNTVAVLALRRRRWRRWRRRGRWQQRRRRRRRRRGWEVGQARGPCHALGVHLGIERVRGVLKPALLELLAALNLSPAPYEDVTLRFPLRMPCGRRAKDSRKPKPLRAALPSRCIILLTNPSMMSTARSFQCVGTDALRTDGAARADARLVVHELSGCNWWRACRSQGKGEAQRGTEVRAGRSAQDRAKGGAGLPSRTSMVCCRHLSQHSLTVCSAAFRGG